MPNNNNNCDPEKKRKILGLSAGFVKDATKFMAWILSATVAIIVFYFLSEAKQEQRISNNKTKAEKTEERLSDHIEHATKAFDRATLTFDKLDSTLTEQRTIINETRITLSAVNATQQEIKKENGRLAQSVDELAKEVRERNGNGP